MNIQRVERIPQFVGHARGQQREGGKFFGFQHGRGPVAGFGDIPENHRQTGHNIVRLADQGDDVKAEKTLAGIKYLQLPGQDLAPLVLVRRKNLLPIQIPQMPGERFADRPIRIETEHFRGGGVEVADFPIASGDDDPFLDGIKKRFEKPLFPRKFQHETLQALWIHPIDSADQFIEKGVFHNPHRFIFDNIARCVSQCRKFYPVSRQNLEQTHESR